MSGEMLTIALPKGRLQEQASELLEQAIGVQPARGLGSSRRLSWEAPDSGLRFLSLRASDIASYVEHGAADAGVVGLDVLREEERDLYEPLDLGIGVCRMVVAAPKDRVVSEDPAVALAALAERGPLRVATKYARIAAAHLAGRGVPSETLSLHGAIEIAPALGIADVVVDITETGETLRQNGMTVLEDVMRISARLVINRVSLKRAPDRVRRLVEALDGVVP